MSRNFRFVLFLFFQHLTAKSYVLGAKVLNQGNFSIKGMFLLAMGVIMGIVGGEARQVLKILKSRVDPPPYSNELSGSKCK